MIDCLKTAPPHRTLRRMAFSGRLSGPLVHWELESQLTRWERRAGKPILRGACSTLILVAVTLCGTVLADGPHVEVVIGENAPALEEFAAQELAAQLKSLYAADVKILREAPEGAASNRILVGSPVTNPAIKALAEKNWPKLSDQGHLVTTVSSDGKDVLLVGGGSPVATLWAAYELGYRLGIRYMLDGDVLPPKSEMKLHPQNVVLEPDLKVRAWSTGAPTPIGQEAWGLAEHTRLLKQLAKLKFNRVLLECSASQPYVHFEYKGIKKQTGVQFSGHKFRVDGDTAGRTAFRGASSFENPDFAGKTTYEERTAAGTALVRGVINAAHDVGLSAGIVVCPIEFPREFGMLFKASPPASDDSLVLRPTPGELKENKSLPGLIDAQFLAYLRTYPELDVICVSEPEGDPDDPATAKNLGTEIQIMARMLNHSGVRERLGTGGGRRLEVLLAWIYTSRAKTVSDAHEEWTFKDPQGFWNLTNTQNIYAPMDELLVLSDEQAGLLPQLRTKHLHAVVGSLRKNKWRGFVTRCDSVGCHDFAVHYLSRASFDKSVTPESATDEFFTAICGDKVSERLNKSFAILEELTNLLDKDDTRVAQLSPDVVLRQLKEATPPPEAWSKIINLYIESYSESLRGKTRSAGEGNPMLHDLSKRLEFAFEYLGSVSAARAAAVAGEKGDVEAQQAELEKAVEGMYNALNALGSVARDGSDRGIVAVLNEYGYKPLQQKLESLEK